MAPLFLKKLLIRTGLARLFPAVRRLVGDGAGFLHYYSDRLLAAPHAELKEAAEFLEPPHADAIKLSCPAFSSSVIREISSSTNAGDWTCPTACMSARAGLASHAATAPAPISAVRREMRVSNMDFPSAVCPLSAT